MSDRSPNITTHDPFGSLLGYAPGGVAIYSSDYNTADEKEFPNDAAFRSYVGREYMGYKWQCVEFARRYLYLNHGMVFADVGMHMRFSHCVFFAKWLTMPCCRYRRSLMAVNASHKRVRC